MTAKRKRILAISLGLPIALAASYLVWYTHRPTATAIRKEFAPGITYKREVEENLVIHWVQIQLDSPNIEIVGTQGDPLQPLPFKAMLTSEFLTERGCLLAINADFHEPWHSNGIIDYYPHLGDGVNSCGITVTDGKAISIGVHPERPVLSILSGQAHIGELQHDTQTAVAGDCVFLQNGAVPKRRWSEYHLNLEPRTAVGLSEDGNTMWWVVVDGRQPSYSNGISLPELGERMRQRGIHIALNLDGGGSTTLAEAGGEVLNCTIDKRIPGRERPVANHLGVRLRR